MLFFVTGIFGHAFDDVDRFAIAFGKNPARRNSFFQKIFPCRFGAFGRKVEVVGIVAANIGMRADLDDHAMALVVSVVGLQDQVSEGVASAVKKADTKIHLVCRLSIAVASAMTLITLTTGMIFAINLARRLIRVQEQAKRVGEGQLETTIEVKGRDEIDGIAELRSAILVKDLSQTRQRLEKCA